MKKIVILGAGVMGSAFSIPLSDRGYEVRLVGTHLDTDIIEEIHQNRVHPKLRSRIPDNVTPYIISGLEEALQGADLLVLGVNSQGVHWAANILNPILPSSVPVLMLTKGLMGDREKLAILPDVVRQGLAGDVREQIQIMAVGGPSIAGELASRRHTCVVVTGKDQALLDQLCDLLRNPYYHIWTSTDLVGVETCVALKNAYALAVGLVHGWLEKEGIGDNGAVMYNLAAGIFAQGLWEMAHVVVDYMGGRLESVYTLPGSGDLYVTSQGGRNSKMGRFLGIGMGYQEAKTRYMPDDTIEGAELLLEIGPTIETLVERGELDGSRLPLLRAMARIVSGQAPPELPWDDFFKR